MGCVPIIFIFLILCLPPLLLVAFYHLPLTPSLLLALVRLFTIYGLYAKIPAVNKMLIFKRGYHYGECHKTRRRGSRFLSAKHFSYFALGN
jgi:hypothetical protein